MTKAEIQKRYRIRHSEAVRAADRERKRKLAGKVRVQKELRAEGAVAVMDAVEAPSDPAEALFAWFKDKLRIPPGHDRAGSPFEVAEFGKAFLRDVLDPETKEISLIIARKNGKSFLVACLLAAYLAEGAPLRQRGFKAGVVSLNREKAGLLAGQIEAIAGASRAPGSQVFRPPPSHHKIRLGRGLYPASR